MKPIEQNPLNLEEVSHLFYALEFAPQEKKHTSLQQIASKIPWQYSVRDTIDQLKDPVLRSISRSYIHLIQRERVYIFLKKISEKNISRNYEDLEEGVFLISEVGDPDSSYMRFQEELERLSQRIQKLFTEHKDILTHESKLQILIRVLCEEEGFTGNSKNYDNPENSFITKVLDTKLGLPITLSVLYILVGRRLNLPLYGTNMPFHFLLLYDSEEYSTFIDPFNNGILLSKDTCENFLNLHGFEPSKKYFARSSTSSILRRMIKNLINGYKKTNQSEMVDLFSQYLHVIEKKR